MFERVPRGEFHRVWVWAKKRGKPIGLVEWKDNFVHMLVGTMRVSI